MGCFLLNPSSRSTLLFIYFFRKVLTLLHVVELGCILEALFPPRAVLPTPSQFFGGIIVSFNLWHASQWQPSFEEWQLVLRTGSMGPFDKFRQGKYTAKTWFWRALQSLLIQDFPWLWMDFSWSQSPYNCLSDPEKPPAFIVTWPFKS